MACPHVTGVVAQLLEKYPTATPLDIFDYLSCDAVPDIMHMDSRDTISKDLLLQAPTNPENAHEHCNPGIGCASDCSNVGVCLPAPLNSSHLECYCDGGYYGPTCSATSDPLCAAQHYSMVVTMADSYGDGWTFTNYVLQDANTLEVVDGAYNSLCYDASGKSTYCVPISQCYIFNVNRGYFPEEVGWTVCGQNGGAPSTMHVCISGTTTTHGSTGTCSMSCPSEAQKIPLVLVDEYGDGWEGAYYAIYDTTTGSQTYGGTLIDGKTLTHNVCLPKGSCSVLVMERHGSHPEEVSMTVCGYTAGSDAVVNLCVDSNGACTATTLHTDNGNCRDDNDVEVLMFAEGLQGWQGASIEVTTSTSDVVASTTLQTGFVDSSHLCIPDGCYDFEAVSSGDSSTDAELFWIACGHVGKEPATSRLCVDYAHGLCYGLPGCPTSLSFARARYTSCL
jgi:hypothetical protein